MCSICCGHWRYVGSGSPVKRWRPSRGSMRAVAWRSGAQRQGSTCGWSRMKQPKMRKRLAQEAEFSNDYAGSLLPEQGAVSRKEVEETLDAAIRSASLVEHIHAALRPRLTTCRGQVDQAMLELFASGHNHRRCVRGKRAGKAPIEILTGKEMEKTWLDSLLETT